MASFKSGLAIVTPASRGLGYAFAQQLLAHTNLPVVATARTDCDGVRNRLLEDLGHDASTAEKRLSVFKVDVTGIDLSVAHRATTPDHRLTAA